MKSRKTKLDAYFALFNCHLNNAKERARKEFIEKYGLSTWKREIQPIIDAGIMSIFQQAPNEWTQFYVDTITRIVNEDRESEDDSTLTLKRAASNFDSQDRGLPDRLELTMNDELNLIAGIEQIPQEMTARLVYADWLEEHGRAEEAKFLRLVEMTGEEFQRSVVGQKDDEDYEESGWVACRVKRGGNLYGLVARYGHCSCYDTWASICGGGISDYYPPEQTMQPSFDWVGTWDGLLRLAKEGVNPRTGKPISESVDDWECRWLKETYEQVLATNG